MKHKQHKEVRQGAGSAREPHAKSKPSGQKQTGQEMDLELNERIEARFSTDITAMAAESET